MQSALSQNEKAAASASQQRRLKRVEFALNAALVVCVLMALLVPFDRLPSVRGWGRATRCFRFRSGSRPPVRVEHKNSIPVTIDDGDRLSGGWPPPPLVCGLRRSLTHGPGALRSSDEIPLHPWHAPWSTRWAAGRNPRAARSRRCCRSPLGFPRGTVRRRQWYSHRCKKDVDCCTRFCKQGRCRCKKLGQGCTRDRNCCANGGQPRTCQSGRCQTIPTCTDGIQNQGESDIDCGGPCPRCANGRTCASRDDCASAYCVGGTCQSCPGGDESCFGPGAGASRRGSGGGLGGVRLSVRGMPRVVRGHHRAV
jgi:hypothetical protein